MELGLDFDDTDFVEKVKEKQNLSSYNAKVCYPKWFLNEKADNGKNDPSTLYKFRGDYQYHHKNINSAIDSYRHSLECLGSHNRTMRRELVDSLARCYIQMKEFTLAKEFLDQVFTECLTIDNWCQALLLKQRLMCSSENYIEEVKVLHQLITIFSGNSEFWVKLSDAYSKILKLRPKASLNGINNSPDTLCQNDDGINKNCDKTTLHNDDLTVDKKVSNEHKHTIQDTTNEFSKGMKNLHMEEPLCDSLACTSKHVCISNTEYMEITSGYPLDLILLTCLIRARLVFCGVQVTVEAFVKDRNVKFVEKLSQQIAELSFNESVIERATRYLRRDMYEDESTDTEDKPIQDQDAKAMMERRVTCAEFNQKWFSWIKSEHESCSTSHK